MNTARSSKGMQPRSPSKFQLREIALLAMCDERTLKRALRGERVQQLGRERIRRALEAKGLLHLLPTEESR